MILIVLKILLSAFCMGIPITVKDHSEKSEIFLEG